MADAARFDKFLGCRCPPPEVSHPATKAQSGSGQRAAHFAKLAPQQRKELGQRTAPSAQFAPGWQPGSGQQAAHFAQLAPQGWRAASFEQLAPNWQLESGQRTAHFEQLAPQGWQIGLYPKVAAKTLEGVPGWPWPSLIGLAG